MLNRQLINQGLVQSIRIVGRRPPDGAYVAGVTVSIARRAMRSR